MTEKEGRGREEVATSEKSQVWRKNKVIEGEGGDEIATRNGK